LRGRFLLTSVAAWFVLAAPAHAAETAVIVVDDLDLQAYAQRGAVGLMVPGAGSKVSGRGARAALVRGQVETALTGGVPDGNPLISLARRPADVTFYVALPGPGSQVNDRRYPVAVVGDGYGGLLESSSTRVPGLISVADVAPSAVAIEEGKKPRITARDSADPVGHVRELDARLGRSRDARFGVDLVFIASLLLASIGALRLRSALLGRAAVLVAPAGLSLALALSALDVDRPCAVIAAFAAGVPLLALATAAMTGSRVRLLFLLTAFLGAYALVLWLWPEVNSLAAIGPHPYGGGRFFGLTNQTATLLLPPMLVAGALAGIPWLGGIAILSLAVVGLSVTGADGGGVLVALAAFGVLALRLADLRLTARRLAALGAAVVVAGLLVVGLDAAAGGESHVTRSLGSGPGSFAEDLAHRFEVSVRGPTSSPMPFLITVSALALLIWIATRRPRHAVVDAMLAGVAVSLVVNDTPQDVATFGALGALALLSFGRTASG
jgi:hypothetical protein